MQKMQKIITIKFNNLLKILLLLLSEYIYMNIKININEHIFKTKVLTEYNEIMLGMMGKKFTKKFDALLFVMNTPKQSFWMKNCIIPLDIIFIKDNIITKIHHNCPPCKSKKDNGCKSYKGIGNLVLEIPGGTCEKLKIMEGDIILFNLNSIVLKKDL